MAIRENPFPEHIGIEGLEMAERKRLREKTVDT